MHKSPSIFNDLSEVEPLAAVVRETISIRDALHLNEVQRLMAQAGIIQHEPITVEEVETILGNRLTIQMRSLTDGLITSVDKLVSRLETLIELCHAEGKKHYSGHQILRMVHKN